MAGLMNAVEKGRGGLKKAGDAGHDPADLSASTETSEKDGRNADQTDVRAASETTGKNAGISASGNDVTFASAPVSGIDSSDASGSDGGADGGADGANVSLDAGVAGSANTGKHASHTAGSPASSTAVDNASRSVSAKEGRNAGRTASTKAGSTAGRKAGKKTSKKGRRIGRPAGPDRTPLTVRILADIDDALTDAVEQTGMSPQYIADDALRTWLIQHGYMSQSVRAS